MMLEVVTSQNPIILADWDSASGGTWVKPVVCAYQDTSHEGHPLC
jgi:hypothetical protein